MNLLLVTNQLTLGGAEQFVVRLANSLKARGQEPLVASSGGPLGELLSPGIRQVIVSGRAKSPWPFWGLCRDLGRIMRSYEIDVVHANSPTTAVAARLARGRLPIPIIASAHGVWSSKALPAVAQLFAAAGDRVVGCSEALTRDLVGCGLPDRKASTIHNGIPFPLQGRTDRSATRKALGIAARQSLILTAARLTDQKGLRYLIEAMREISGKFPASRLLIAGDGDRRSDLESQVLQAGLGDKVRFLGARSDVPDLLLAADLFCLPSLQEGLPLALAEAMAAGLPVVATPVGGVPELVADGQTGWLVKPQDSQALAERIVCLLDNPLLAQNMGEAGWRRVAAEFTLEIMVERFLALYQLELSRATRAATSRRSAAA